jgi:hypothetical protein
MDDRSIQPNHPSDEAEEEPVFIEDDHGVWHLVGFSPPAEHERLEAIEGQVRSRPDEN